MENNITLSVVIICDWTKFDVNMYYIHDIPTYKLQL